MKKEEILFKLEANGVDVNDDIKDKTNAELIDMLAQIQNKTVEIEKINENKIVNDTVNNNAKTLKGNEYDPNMPFVRYELVAVDKYGKEIIKEVCHRQEIYEAHKNKKRGSKVVKGSETFNIPAKQVKDAAIKGRELATKKGK